MSTAKQKRGADGEDEYQRLVARHAAERAIIVATRALSQYALDELLHSSNPKDVPLGEAIRAYRAIAKPESKT